MDITGSTALVTGANRGIGRHFAAQLLERGAAKVYATARDPRRIDLPGVEALRLDVTDPASIAAAAEAAPDVDLIVNNAGVSLDQPLVTGDLDTIRLELETNLFGPLGVVRAFAPILAASGGGAVVNVLSAMSWTTFVGAGGYGVAKAAEWSMTSAIRLELAGQGAQVLGLGLAATNTEMMAGRGVEVAQMNNPADVVRQALDGLQAGALEVLADEDTRAAKAAVALGPAEVWPQLAATP